MGKQEELKLHKPWFCSKCGGELKPVCSGTYECTVCKNLEYDDFGKVKKYIEENGRQPAVILAEKTGVAIATIDTFLKTGRLEIPDGASVYIKCERCGCDIRYGRYCPECMKILAGDVKKAFFNENLGEKPKKKVASKNKDEMFVKEWLKRK